MATLHEKQLSGHYMHVQGISGPGEHLLCYLYVHGGVCKNYWNMYRINKTITTITCMIVCVICNM